MDDKRLDELIAGTLPSAPPDDVAGAVTPWRRAMCQVLWGFGLGAVTFNFYGLNYILPAIGTLLMLCGFRTLRRENAFFMACYVIGIVRTLAAIARLVVNSTVYAYDERVLEFWQNLAWAGVIMHLVLVLLLWNALSAVQRRAGQMPHAGAALWLFVWNLVVAVLALIGAQFGMLFGIALLAAFALIIRSLYKLYCELDGIGYVIKATPGRVSNRALTITLIAVTLALMACGYVFFSKYPMDWLPAETSGESETRAELAELGFPEEVLADISDVDVARCAGATQVHCTKNDFGAVDVTMIAVQMPRDPLHWLTFHYFEIDDGLDYSTTEGIRLNSSYAMSVRDNFWRKAGEPTGMVLYDAGDATLSAPMARIRSGTYTDSIMFGTYYNPVTLRRVLAPGRSRKCTRLRRARNAQRKKLERRADDRLLLRALPPLRQHHVPVQDGDRPLSIWRTGGSVRAAVFRLPGHLPGRVAGLSGRHKMGKSHIDAPVPAIEYAAGRPFHSRNGRPYLRGRENGKTRVAMLDTI